MTRYPLAVAMSRMADQVGLVLSGRYRLIAPIGTGSSAQVYLADDVRLRRRVAVKVLHAALADDESFLRRFRAEAQAAAALNHPHILAVYDWGEHDGMPYLITEYLAGGSLRAILDRGARLTLSQALLVGLEATRALDTAHRRGFVHRDIKPANLLFGDEGRLRVADFGLARALAEAAWTEPQGAVLGTARYASPEQAQGQSVTGKADIYALGLVLIESVTGTVPFTADTTIGTLMARVDRDLDVPEEMGALATPLGRAGQADPEARPDARDLAAALMACAGELPRPQPLPLVPTAPSGAGNGVELDEGDDTLHGGLPGSVDITAMSASAANGVDESVVSVPDPWATTSASVFDDDLAPEPPRRRRWPIVLAAVMLAALIGGGAAWGWTESRPPEHKIPNLVGTTETEARQLVDDFGWKIDVEKARKDNTEAGRVLETSPGFGAELKEGGRFVLVVSEGWTLAPVPTGLVGKPAAEVQAAIEKAQFVPKPSEAFSEDVETGRVISVQEGLPAELAKRTPIAYVVSKGPEPRMIPGGLAGGPLAPAARCTREAGPGAARCRGVQ